MAKNDDRRNGGKGNNKGNKGRHHKRLGKGLLGQTPEGLQASSNKEIRDRAKELMSKLYAPVFQDLDYQQQSAQSIYDKRQSDNQYYLDWLNTQSQSMDANAQSADQQLVAQQQQIQNASAAAMAGLREQLVAQGGATPGAVSNAAQFSGNDVTADAAQAQGLIANERQRTAQLMGTAAQNRQTLNASNVAAIQAASRAAQGDLATTSKDISSARQKAGLEQSGKAAEEVSRLLDQEITKAQSRVDMRNTAAQLALALKQHRMDKARFLLDKMVANAQISQAQADSALDRATLEANIADDRTDNQQAAENAQDDRQGERQDDRQTNQDDRREQRQEQKELQREAVTQATQGVRAIQNNPDLQKMLNGKNGINKVAKWLQKHGADGNYALLAAQYVHGTGVSGNIKKTLRGLGIDVSDLLKAL